MAETAKTGKKSTKSKKATPKIGSEQQPATIIPTHEDIARLAYRLWEERGYEHGHADEDWNRAEDELQTS